MPRARLSTAERLVSLGTLAAVRRGTLIDRAIMAVSVAGVSMPIFFIGLILIQYVGYKWDLLPFTGRTEFLDPESGARHVVGRAEQYRADYQARANRRLLDGQRRLASAIAGGAPMYERPADRRFGHDVPEKVSQSSLPTPRRRNRRWDTSQAPVRKSKSVTRPRCAVPG